MNALWGNHVCPSFCLCFISEVTQWILVNSTIGGSACLSPLLSFGYVCELSLGAVKGKIVRCEGFKEMIIQVMVLCVVIW